MPSIARVASLVVLVGACLVGCESGAPTSVHPSVDGYPRGHVEIVTSQGTRTLTVLLADTSARRRHGLMEVEELPDGIGMLFTGYEEDRTGGFWMKDTLIPLSIAFIAADGTIVDILHMEPCVEEPCPTYAPDAPYRSALEVRQGWFADRGVQAGDVVEQIDP